MYTPEQRKIASLAVLGCTRNPQAHSTEECLQCEFKHGMCNAYKHIKTIFDLGLNGEIASEINKETPL